MKLLLILSILSSVALADDSFSIEVNNPDSSPGACAQVRVRSTSNNTSNLVKQSIECDENKCIVKFRPVEKPEIDDSFDIERDLNQGEEISISNGRVRIRSVSNNSSNFTIEFGSCGDE